jgi:hypothetical protein
LSAVAGGGERVTPKHVAFAPHAALRSTQRLKRVFAIEIESGAPEHVEYIDYSP